MFLGVVTPVQAEDAPELALIAPPDAVAPLETI